MEFSHGLCFGRRQLTILTPPPLSLTSRLCLPSQRLTSLETCQLALSQMSSRTFFPAASSFSRLHSRNRVVMELTGDRKSTRLNSSHANISYAVFCLKKKNQPTNSSPALVLINKNAHSA